MEGGCICKAVFDLVVVSIGTAFAAGVMSRCAQVDGFGRDSAAFACGGGSGGGGDCICVLCDLDALGCYSFFIILELRLCKTTVP